MEHTIDQVVGHQLFTMETCFHSKGIPCRIVVDKVAMGQGFIFPCTLVFLLLGVTIMHKNMSHCTIIIFGFFSFF